MRELVKNRIDASIVAIVFSAIAVASAVLAGGLVQEHAKARASELWPIYEGIVLSVSDDASGAERIRYVYSVSGYSEIATRQRFLTGGFRKPMTDPVKVGDRIDVYVDPQNRRESVLEPGGGDALFLSLLSVCAAGVFLGLAGAVRSFGILLRSDSFNASITA